MNNIMDSLFNGMAGSEFYRSQVFPELYPHEPRMLIENWHPEDLESYCGLTASLEPTRSYTSSGSRKDG
jgi:hypothetical protein